jgi:hypothetical protein
MFTSGKGEVLAGFHPYPIPPREPVACHLSGLLQDRPVFFVELYVAGAPRGPLNRAEGMIAQPSRNHRGVTQRLLAAEMPHLGL